MTKVTSSTKHLFKLLSSNTKQLKALQKKLRQSVGKKPKKTAADRTPMLAAAAAAEADQYVWTEGEVWNELRNKIIPTKPPPPVEKTTPMSQVLVRISMGLLCQRINATFFPPPFQAGKVTQTEIGECGTAGHLWILICNHLAQQGRLA